MAINQAHVHPHYTLPGVMHYLQNGFTKNERDRITWELEAVSPEGEKEEKHVPDSLLQSKLAVQENVKK
ncbi:BTE_HP_G0221930.mRNA.1.CDS.1 [Saccharomyces cerevisiae]|nr:BTE_HP_G0221930.mRNA.1.CDS.1 [Saccharomyces cerevisiae]CAI6435684.1 BTE_HP_G0221930.mRNA.1.CDS.1 [Saccharomyces cerevisiae]